MASESLMFSISYSILSIAFEAPFLSEFYIILRELKGFGSSEDSLDEEEFLNLFINLIL
jgi:hypothetical protein